MNSSKQKTPYLIFFAIAVLIVILFSAVFLLKVLIQSSSFETKNQTVQVTKDYHIFITGTGRNNTFINKIYEGAQLSAQNYNAAVQLYLPDSQAEHVSLQSLFDYASYLEPDGIIAFVDDDQQVFDIPCYKNGTPIPLITTGTYNPNLPQLSFIGINYSKLSNIFVSEIQATGVQDGNIIILINRPSINPSYGMLINELTQNLGQKGGINILTLAVRQSPTSYIEDSIRQEIASTGNLKLIVSLTESNSVLAAQTITDLNQAGKIKIIGFGDGENSKHYFNKGIITKLISVTPEEIGKKAVNELFEYKNTGYANSYVIADVEVNKRER